MISGSLHFMTNNVFLIALYDEAQIYSSGCARSCQIYIAREIWVLVWSVSLLRWHYSPIQFRVYLLPNSYKLHITNPSTLSKRSPCFTLRARHFAWAHDSIAFRISNHVRADPCAFFFVAPFAVDGSGVVHDSLAFWSAISVAFPFCCMRHCWFGEFDSGIVGAGFLVSGGFRLDVIECREGRIRFNVLI